MKKVTSSSRCNERLQTDSNEDGDTQHSRPTRSTHLTAALTDADIVARVRAGEHGLFEVLMRRHNQRLYRAARAILRDEAEVEDVLQQTYMNAFSHLHQFEARSQFSTWLTRILINEASHRRRKQQRVSAVSAGLDQRKKDLIEAATASGPDPEHRAYANELLRVLEEAIDSLPEAYRVVFVLRDVEGMSTGETAKTLGLGDEAVKTRLHRGRVMLRRLMTGRIGAVTADAFQFHAPRCDRLVATALKWITQHSGDRASDGARADGDNSDANE
jgi:RNA polymerase sigma-70 factor (ECF subfamily)